MNRIQLMKEYFYLKQRLQDAELALRDNCDKYMENANSCRVCDDNAIRNEIERCSERPYFLKYYNEDGTEKEDIKKIACLGREFPIDTFDVITEIGEGEGVIPIKTPLKHKIGINECEATFQIPKHLGPQVLDNKYGFYIYMVSFQAHREAKEKLYKEIQCTS